MKKANIYLRYFLSHVRASPCALKVFSGAIILQYHPPHMEDFLYNGNKRMDKEMEEEKGKR